MAILLSHTSAIEALRRLGALPEVRAGDGSAYPAVSMTPGAGDALLAWRKAFGSEPALPIHVQLPAGSRRVRSRGLVTHPLRDLPAGAIFKISNGLLCLTPAALCLQMAPRLTRLELLVLVQELMGTYAIRPDVARGMATREAPHLAPDDLRDFLSRNGGMRGADKAAWVLERAVPHAASPRESKLVIRLSLKPAMGGYGLPVRGLTRRWLLPRLSRMARRFADLTSFSPIRRQGRAAPSWLSSTMVPTTRTRAGTPKTFEEQTSSSRRVFRSTS